MNAASSSFLAAAAATMSLAAIAAPSTTDEARAARAQRTAETAHCASLPAPPERLTIRVTDGDSARLATGQANARRTHDAYCKAVAQVGAGVRSTPIKVSDTDSARAAAGQKRREDALAADYADYKKRLVQDALEPALSVNQ